MDGCKQYLFHNRVEEVVLPGLYFEVIVINHRATLFFSFSLIVFTQPSYHSIDSYIPYRSIEAEAEVEATEEEESESVQIIII